MVHFKPQNLDAGDSNFVKLICLMGRKSDKALYIECERREVWLWSSEQQDMAAVLKWHRVLSTRHLEKRRMRPPF